MSEYMDELDRLFESIGLNEWEKTGKPQYIKELRFVLDNLSEKSRYKEPMRKYIDYLEKGEKESGISMDESTRLYHLLEDAGLIKDRSGEELWKQIQERETGEKITAEVVDFSTRIGGIVNEK